MSEPMPEVTLKIDVNACLKIALGLRRVEFLLQQIVEGTLPDEERTSQKIGIRQEQLLWLAGKFEQAVKEAAPELPAHQRPKQNRKMVWCATEGCERALTREQARFDPHCPLCREKKPAA
jgi:hypothetical protein